MKLKKDLKILKLKKNKCYHQKTDISFRDIDFEKVLVRNSFFFFFGWQNYKYVIGYLFNGNKFKAIHITLPKTSAFGKCYNGKTKWMYFLLTMMTY